MEELRSVIEAQLLVNEAGWFPVESVLIHASHGGELGVAPAPDTSNALAFGSSEAEEKEGTGLLLLE